MHKLTDITAIAGAAGTVGALSVNRNERETTDVMEIALRFGEYHLTVEGLMAVISFTVAVGAFSWRLWSWAKNRKKD